MTALRRLACGQFDVTASHTPDELQKLLDQGRPLPLLSPADALSDWPELSVSGSILARLQDGVAPNMSDLDVSALVAGDRVRFMVDDALISVARFAPGGHGKRPGDFEIIKVFPLIKEE
jgi:hypothetical protein